MTANNEIISLLREKHDQLFSWLEVKGTEFWDYGPEGKWTTGQHVIHLVQSMKPLNKAMRIPKFILKFKFGTSNRIPRSYDKVKERYLMRLAENKGVVSPFSSKMPATSPEEMPGWINRLSSERNLLVTTIRNRWTEKDLDTYLLPHPLMGRMPVKEILLWTAYHTEHHTQLIQKQASFHR